MTTIYVKKTGTGLKDLVVGKTAVGDKPDDSEILFFPDELWADFKAAEKKYINFLSLFKHMFELSTGDQK